MMDRSFDIIPYYCLYLEEEGGVYLFYFIYPSPDMDIVFKFHCPKLNILV